MAKSVLSSDTMPKAGRVNEMCREWSVHEDGALAYRLQDEEIKEHYTGNKVRNAQVREDLPRARVEQELEELRYHSIVQQQEERDALVARQIALKLEREERLRERELQERMRSQLRLDDEAAQLEAKLEIERRSQEEKDQELARKLQEQEEKSIDTYDAPIDDQLIRDQKFALEAQDAELARMLQDKERAKVRRARERAKQKKLERLQMQQQGEVHDVTMEPERPSQLDVHGSYDRNKTRINSNRLQKMEDPEEIQVFLKKERAKQKKLERLQMQQQGEVHDITMEPERPSQLDVHGSYDRNKTRINFNRLQKMEDPEEIQVLENSPEETPELPNVAAIIDPTYSASGSGHRSISSSSSSTVSPSYLLPTPPQEFMSDAAAPCYMPIQGQRRTQMQSPSLSHEEKHKRRVKDGCKNQ